jgi:hypothetical protein
MMPQPLAARRGVPLPDYLIHQAGSGIEAPSAKRLESGFARLRSIPKGGFAARRSRA